ncbi:RDD family protein [Chryseobacterium sp.]|uniref:RDD family protein n=1 Tax=Chryseobacterium sp. TaxID=1871047 RepID=UPI0025BA45B6|nr:RDD family protein [Chryseobacterium sp.]MBV8328741.1 RDD family protein [Chryseobacterium sp.]
METNLLLSGFWKRIMAFLIDSIILGIFGLILGFLFKNFFIALGGNAKCIGWFISLVYFSVFNSKLNKGQTPGKRIMGIRVIDINGQFIDIKTSLIRALILTLPFFLNGYKIPGVSPFSILTVFQSMIIFAIGIGLVVFYIVNKETRQSVHDVIVKTLVVQDYRDIKLTKMPQITKKPFYITAGLVIVIFCVSIYNFMGNSDVKKLIPVYESILKQENVANAGVSIKTYPLNNNSTVYFITVQLKTDLPKIDNPTSYIIQNKEAQQAVKTFINSHIYKTDHDVLNVTISSGYDIGIAKSYHWVDTFRPVFQWKELYQF